MFAIRDNRTRVIQEDFVRAVSKIRDRGRGDGAPSTLYA
jgi:ATP-dependent 26S proteasome regulatory subunit